MEKIHPLFYSWLDDEVGKIHQNYAEKRKEIDGDAFLVGFSGNSESKLSRDISNRYQALSHEEETAANTFRQQAIEHERKRLELIEIEHKKQISHSWDNFKRRNGIK